jgi:hypothetical protein
LENLSSPATPVASGAQYRHVTEMYKTMNESGAHFFFTGQEQQTYSVICLETSIFSVTLVCVVAGMLVMLFIIIFMAKRLLFPINMDLHI